MTKKYQLLWWLTEKFSPNIYNGPWYNGLKEETDVYIENKMSVFVGMPWMRQLRVKKGRLITNFNLNSSVWHYLLRTFFLVFPVSDGEK